MFLELPRCLGFPSMLSALSAMQLGTGCGSSQRIGNDLSVYVVVADSIPDGQVAVLQCSMEVEGCVRCGGRQNPG